MVEFKLLRRFMTQTVEEPYQAPSLRGIMLFTIIFLCTSGISCKNPITSPGQVLPSDCLSAVDQSGATTVCQHNTIRFFDKMIPVASVVEAEIIQISENITDYGAMNYPDCFISCIAAIKNIQSGEPVAQRIMIYLPEVHNRKPCGSLPKEKSKVKLKIASYSKLPQEIQQIQINDNLDEFDLPVYAGEVITSLKNFSNSGIVPSSVKPHSKKILTFDIDLNAQKIREDTIQKDLAAAQKNLKELEEKLPTLKAIERSKQEWIKRNGVLIEKNKYRLETTVDGLELILYSQAKPFSSPDKSVFNKINELQKLQIYLKKYNIDLIFVPIPSHTDFYFCAAFPELQNYHSYFYSKLLLECLANDIETIDVWSEVFRHKDICRRPFNKDHWYPVDIARVAGYLIAERLRRYPYKEQESFGILHQYNIVISNSSKRSLNNTHSYHSPFFTLGNSFGHNPHHSSIKDWGSYYSGIEIDGHTIGDGQRYLDRVLFQNRNILNHRYACILVMRDSHIRYISDLSTLQLEDYSLILSEKSPQLLGKYIKIPNDKKVINSKFQVNADSNFHGYINLPTETKKYKDFILNITFSFQNKNSKTKIFWDIDGDTQNSVSATNNYYLQVFGKKQIKNNILHFRVRTIEGGVFFIDSLKIYAK